MGRRGPTPVPSRITSTSSRKFHPGLAPRHPRQAKRQRAQQISFPLQGRVDQIFICGIPQRTYQGSGLLMALSQDL